MNLRQRQRRPAMISFRKLASTTLAATLFLSFSISCNQTSDKPAEKDSGPGASLSVEAHLLEHNPIEHQALAASIPALAKESKQIIEACRATGFPQEEATADATAFRKQCYGPLHQVMTQGVPFEGATFQTDRFLAALSRSHDSVRIHGWRLKYESGDLVVNDGHKDLKRALDKLELRATEIEEAESVESLIEARFGGVVTESVARFLESDRRELALLFDQLSRSAFNQAENPNQIRDRIISHRINVSKRRLIVRTLHVKKMIEGAQGPANLGEDWSEYAQRGFRFLGSAENGLEKVMKPGGNEPRGIRQEKAKIAQYYLEWLESFEKMLADYGA